jgi:predicted aspartyl protease
MPPSKQPWRKSSAQWVCTLALLSAWSTLGQVASAENFTPVDAIVQLQGLDVPPAQVKGSDTIPLKVLEQTQVYTAEGLLGQLPGRFLIDTGASTTILSPEVVQSLRLPGKTILSERLSSAVAGNGCTSMTATLHGLPPLKLKSVEIRGASGLRFEKTVIPDGLSGVIGMDILNHFDLQLNPKVQTLSLSPPTILPKPAATVAIPLQRKLGVFLANLTLNGQGPFTLLLDTGADSTFISAPLAQRLKLDPKTRQPIQILGFCGLEPAERSQLTSVQLQQHEQKNIEAIILSSSILKLLGVDGILGQNFLSRYQQYWRFTPFSVGNVKADGSLLLWPQLAPSAPQKSTLTKP